MAFVDQTREELQSDRRGSGRIGLGFQYFIVGLCQKVLIANTLGVRREGVTAAAKTLQKLGLIRYARGRIVVLDRAGLQARSCECYSVVKREYDRLLPGRPAD